MTGETQIYVRLLEESVDVWRPVAARPLGGKALLIAEQPYDRQTESWQFEPGDAVVCKIVDTDKGQILAAFAKAPRPLGGSPLRI